jgi:hypothetical protein
VTKYRGTILWSLAGLCALGTGVFGDKPASLQAFPIAAVCALALPWPWRFWARMPRRLRELTGPVILMILCGYFYAPLLAGHLPVNHDHPILFLHAWVTGLLRLQTSYTA